MSAMQELETLQTFDSTGLTVVHHHTSRLPRASKARDTTLATMGNPERGTWRSDFTIKVASMQ
jgi:hypothetical protein